MIVCPCYMIKAYYTEIQRLIFLRKADYLFLKSKDIAQLRSATYFIDETFILEVINVAGFHLIGLVVCLFVYVLVFFR